MNGDGSGACRGEKVIALELCFLMLYASSCERIRRKRARIMYTYYGHTALLINIIVPLKVTLSC